MNRFKVGDKVMRVRDTVEMGDMGVVGEVIEIVNNVSMSVLYRNNKERMVLMCNFELAPENPIENPVENLKNPVEISETFPDKSKKEFQMQIKHRVPSVIEVEIKDTVDNFELLCASLGQLSRYDAQRTGVTKEGFRTIVDFQASLRSMLSHLKP